MTTLYKLTNQDWTTHNNCKWGPGVQHKTSGEGNLCGPGWTHWYTHPLLAVLLNPIHANFQDPILWEGEGTIGKNDRGLKVGCTDGKTVKIIPLPTVTLEQRVKFAILCSLAVYKEKKFVDWANNWLSGKNRKSEAADAAAHAAHAAYATAYAAYAAYATAYAAYDAAASSAANTAYAAYAADNAANAAYAAHDNLDLVKLTLAMEESKNDR